MLPTPRNKTLIVETDENKKEVVVGNDHDDQAKVDVIDENAKVDVVDENESNETSNTKVDEVDKITSGTTSAEVPKGESDEVLQVFVSRADVEQLTETPEQELSVAPVVSVPDDAAPSAQHRALSTELLSKLSTCQTKQSEQHSWTENRSTKRNQWCNRRRLRRTASLEPCDSSWKESGSRKNPNVDTNVPVLFLLTNGNHASENRATDMTHSCPDSFDVAVPSIETSACAKGIGHTAGSPVR